MAKKDKNFVIKEEVSNTEYSEVLKNHKYLENYTSKNPNIKVIQGNVLRSFEIY